MPFARLPLACALSALLPACALAHAIVGDRVFPATIAVDDPGVNDELDTHYGRTNAGSGQWTSDAGTEFDKRITDNFGLSISGDWLDTNGTTGMDNVGVGAKYVFYTNAPHETMFSAGIDWDIGNTGAKRIADNFSTLTPTFYFGKGMGDLPDGADWFKPFAVTGSLGLSLPTERYSTSDDGPDFNPNFVNWGATLQYSVPYLEQHVKDTGLAAPWNLMVPVVELSLQTPTGGPDRETTGSVNPGVLFMGTDYQVGLEAVVPVNRASGDRVGAIIQWHFYLDNLYPSVMRPLW